MIVFFRILGRGQLRDPPASKRKCSICFVGKTEYVKPRNYDAKHDQLKNGPNYRNKF